MRIVFLTTYSPAKGRRLAAGSVEDVPDEVAMDLIARGLAEPSTNEGTNKRMGMPAELTDKGD